MPDYLFFKYKFFIIFFNNFFYHVNICSIEFQICIKKTYEETFIKIKFIFFFFRIERIRVLD